MPGLIRVGIQAVNYSEIGSSVLSPKSDDKIGPHWPESERIKGPGSLFRAGLPWTTGTHRRFGPQPGCNAVLPETVVPTGVERGGTAVTTIEDMEGMAGRVVAARDRGDMARICGTATRGNARVAPALSTRSESSSFAVRGSAGHVSHMEGQGPQLVGSGWEGEPNGQHVWPGESVPAGVS